MKNVILELINNGKTKKLSNKDKLANVVFDSDHEITQCSSVEEISDIITKNKNYISDIIVFLKGKSRFSSTKRSYKFNFKNMNDSDQVIDICDSMLQEKDREISELKTKIESLTIQNEKLKICSSKQNSNNNTNMQSTNNSINLNISSEINEIYSGEIKDILLKLISKELSTIDNNSHINNSRKFSILKDIYINNNQTNEDENIIDCFNRAIKDNGDISYKDMNELKHYGIIAEKDNKNHIRIKLDDKINSNVFLTIGSTISDYKAKKNIVSMFSNIFFGY